MGSLVGCSHGPKGVRQVLLTQQQQQQQMAIVLRLGNPNVRNQKDDDFDQCRLQITCKNLISLGICDSYQVQATNIYRFL